MHLFYRYAIPAIWLCWVLYWWVASRDVKIAVRREPLASRLSHIVPLVLALMLLSGSSAPTSLLGKRFLPLTEWPFWLGLLLTVAGVLFSVWARVYLGRNWSGTVTIKQDHELITSGPYCIVRHPIYTGLLLAILGSAVALGQWRGILALALATGALWRKLRFEERWMRERFGAAYDAYAKRVAALVPLVL
jgi:protein-S-isoprenylcysteine O-methyltransferase Ste14